MGLSNWPTLVDDDGSLTLGTEIDKAVFDAIKASIEADMYSSTNPTVTAENAIDEVVAARGSKASLDARLDVALNEDGTLKSQASLVTAASAQELPQTNMVVNDVFLIWAAGDAVAATLRLELANKAVSDLEAQFQNLSDAQQQLIDEGKMSQLEFVLKDPNATAREKEIARLE